MREIKSDEARRDWRDLLDEVQANPEAAVRILRYDRPVAVLVSDEWYRSALTALEGEDGDELAARYGEDA